MLKQMRKHMNWIMWVILILVIVTFLFFGIYPSDGGRGEAAVVNGDVITVRELERAYRTLVETYRQVFKDQFNDGMARNLRQQALRELIQNRLLVQDADRIGLRVSDEEVQAVILRTRAFTSQGRFDKVAYERYLEYINVKPSVFEVMQREHLLKQKIERIVEDGVEVTDDELKCGPKSTYLNCLTLVWLCAWGSLRALAARSSAWSGSRWRPIGGLMVMAVVSAGVAAAQLVPTFQFIPFSSRAGGLNYAFATTFSLPPAYAGLLLVCPHFFGHQGVGYWGAWNQHELTIYAGILPLILVTVAVWAAVHRPDGLALVALAASSLLLAMGEYTPLYRYAYEYLPGVAYFRAPARFLLPFGSWLTASVPPAPWASMGHWATRTAMASPTPRSSRRGRIRARRTPMVTVSPTVGK